MKHIIISIVLTVLIFLVVLGYFLLIKEDTKPKNEYSGKEIMRTKEGCVLYTVVDSTSIYHPKQFFVTLCPDSVNINVKMIY